VEDKPHSGRPSPLWMLKQFQKLKEPEHVNQWITVSEVLNEVCMLYCLAQGIVSEEMNYRWDGSVQGFFNYCWLVIKGSARRQHVLWRQWQHSNTTWRHWLAEDLTLLTYTDTVPCKQFQELPNCKQFHHLQQQNTVWQYLQEPINDNLYRCTVHFVVYLINTPTNAHIFV